MSKQVTIPTDGMNPFVVVHNGQKYVFTPGETVTVPDGIALEIEEYKRWREKYYAKPGGNSGGGVDVTASVGQTIVVKAVDENGKPTEWEAAEYQPRTHYEEWAELLPEPVSTADENGQFLIPVDFVFTVGETYKINYNGTEYTCTAYEYIEGEVTAVCVGNGAVFELSDTGEPFFALTADGMLMAISYEELTEITLGVLGRKYTTIPRPYLPKMCHTVTVLQEHITTGADSLAYIQCDTTELVDALMNNLPVYLDITNVKGYEMRLLVSTWKTLSVTLAENVAVFGKSAVSVVLSAYALGLNSNSNETWNVYINLTD